MQDPTEGRGRLRQPGPRLLGGEKNVEQIAWNFSTLHPRPRRPAATLWSAPMRTSRLVLGPSNAPTRHPAGKILKGRTSSHLPCGGATSRSWQSPARGLLHYVAADSRFAAFFSPINCIDEGRHVGDSWQCVHRVVWCYNLDHTVRCKANANSGPRQLFGEWLPCDCSLHFCTRLADARLSSRIMDRSDGTLTRQLHGQGGRACRKR